MTYFPMFVSLEKKPCLIVGGGKVGARKCSGLLAFGAKVTVIAPQFPGFKELRETGSLEGQENYSLHNGKETKSAAGSLFWQQRRFRDSDLTGMAWRLVIAATDDRETNRRIGLLCRERQIPVNVADCREECTFYFPAYCMEGSTAVGVTTSGENPAMAGALRRRMEKELSGWIREIREERNADE